MTRTPGLLVVLATVLARAAAAQSCDPFGADALSIQTARAAIDAACDCNAPGQTHGEYVRCALANATPVRRECRSTLRRCYSHSTCGKPGAVTCCRTNPGRGTRCNVRRDAAHCTATEGGSACVGTVPSCCDACDGGGCATPTTSTTTSTTTTTTLFPDVPCTGGSGYPSCDGTCDAGFECRGYAGAAGDTCACFPLGSTPCDASAFPQCGGLACPGSRLCGGLQVFDPDTGFHGGCGCVEPTQPCTADTGGRCVSLGYCAPPNVCLYTPILPHNQNCPCCGCGPPQ